MQRKNVFKMTSLLLILTLVFSLVGCAGQKPAAPEAAPEVPQEKIILKFGELNPDTHVMTIAIREFARVVKEKSEGRIEVEVFPSGQLGDQQTMIQSLQMGALDIYRTNPSFLADLGMKQMNVYHLPYLFRDVDHCWDVLNGPIGEEFLKLVDNSGTKMTGFGYYAESPRNFFFTKKEVTKISDMKGLKIRVPESQMYLDVVQAFGASPTPIAYSELYSALQTGVVDGAENPLTGYHTNKFFEVAPNYTIDGHELAPSVIIFSELTWNKLSAEDQKLLSDAFRESEKFMRNLSSQKDEEAIADMKAAGVKILEVENQQEWVDAVKPLYEKYGKEYLSVIERIQNTK
ncbi:TRAP transporter substrate-binding protein [Geosporobacter ferrireducens]|uniref:TRAP transporter substrate-binding protein n=1 Tax=Geosporobacter ferrireducens TaxID=1424294 RepID=UPI00139E1063|nr:TRAP transporter substrate-binding protein [Geosporobacter ferrireducens]MTI58075.1 TRAP transporter substrate-binding protein [Geosporobacter ferrireducens]